MTRVITKSSLNRFVNLYKSLGGTIAVAISAVVSSSLNQLSGVSTHRGTGEIILVDKSMRLKLRATITAIHNKYFSGYVDNNMINSHSGSLISVSAIKCTHNSIFTNTESEDCNTKEFLYSHITIADSTGYSWPLSCFTEESILDLLPIATPDMSSTTSRFNPKKHKPKRKSDIKKDDKVTFVKRGKLRGERLNWCNKVGLEIGKEYTIKSIVKNDMVTLVEYDRYPFNVWHFKKIIDDG